MENSSDPAAKASSTTLFPSAGEQETRSFPLFELVFLAVFSLYLYGCVDLRLVFWNQNDLFPWSARFAHDFLVTPGEPCDWLGRLLLQSCFFGWPGVIAVTASVAVLLFSARDYFSRIGPAPVARYVWVVPAVLLAVLHSQYTFSLSATLALAMAMLASSLYVRISCRQGWFRFAVFAAASLVLNHAVGEAYYVFAACAVIYEFLAAKRRRLGLSLLLVVLAVKFGAEPVLRWLSSEWFRAGPPEASYLIPRPGWEAAMLKALYLYYPVSALIVASRHWAGPLAAALGRFPLGRTRRTARTGPILRTCGWAMAPLIVLAAAGVGVKWSGAAKMKKVLMIDFSASRCDWETVLREAESLPAGIPAEAVSYDINRALYHTGRFPYEMFSYPQSRLLADHSFGARGRLLAREAFDLLLDLGRVNEAETVAHDDLERHLSAEFLKRISSVKRIKGQTGAALVYLNVLCGDLIYGPWAKCRRDRLQEDLDAPEAEIAQARSRMIVTDDAPLTHGEVRERSNSVHADRWLVSLLERDPHNRMAFEYLMASRLIDRNLEEIVRVCASGERILLSRSSAALRGSDDALCGQAPR